MFVSLLAEACIHRYMYRHLKICTSVSIYLDLVSSASKNLKGASKMYNVVTENINAQKWGNKVTNKHVLS